MLLSFDIYSNDQIIDLPVAIDETGAMSIINQSTYNQPQKSSCISTVQSSEASSPTSVVQSTAVSEARGYPTVRECPPSTALSVIESALTEDMLEGYRAAYEAGTDLNDSMYHSCKPYTEQADQPV